MRPSWPTFRSKERRIGLAALDDRWNVATAAVLVGIGRGALEEARTYALDRKQFKKPIADFQAIQWMLADVAMEIDAARMLTHAAASTIDQDGSAERRVRGGAGSSRPARR